MFWYQIRKGKRILQKKMAELPKKESSGSSVSFFVVWNLTRALLNNAHDADAEQLPLQEVTNNETLYRNCCFNIFACCYRAPSSPLFSLGSHRERFNCSLMGKHSRVHHCRSSCGNALAGNAKIRCESGASSSSRLALESEISLNVLIADHEKF